MENVLKRCLNVSITCCDPGEPIFGLFECMRVELWGILEILVVGCFSVGVLIDLGTAVGSYIHVLGLQSVVLLSLCVCIYIYIYRRVTQC